MKLQVLTLVLVALVGFSSALKWDVDINKLPFAPVDQPQYVRTPAGLVWSECLHHMKSNSHVIEKDDGSTVVVDEDGNRFEVPPCEKPIISNKRQVSPQPDSKPDSGWQVWTTFQHPENDTFTSYLGYFTVPDTPLHWSVFSGTGILYYFTGLQSDNWLPIANEPSAPANFDIIQPVLQYGGGSSNGGGKYWGIASWYVTLDNGVLYSELIKVNPGNNIFGNMTQINGESWVIVSVNTDSQESTTVKVSRPRLTTQPWAYNTMECYDIDDCTWFPPAGSSIDFTQLSLTDSQGSIQPIWKANENENHCSAALTIPSPDNVVISF